MKTRNSHKKCSIGHANLFTCEFSKKNKFLLRLKGSNSKISWNIFVWIMIFKHVTIEIEMQCLKDNDLNLSEIET